MLPSFFRKTIIIDTWKDPARAPSVSEAAEAAILYAQQGGLSWRLVGRCVIEIANVEYDIVPKRVFRGSYAVALVRR